MEKKIFGKTDGIRGRSGEEPLTEKTMRKLGLALGDFWKEGKIVVGRDTRGSGVWITKKIEEGLSEKGLECVDCGILPTPVLAVSTGYEDGVMGGVMVTASHNPAEDNGVKIFDKYGYKLGTEEEQKIEMFMEENDDSSVGGGSLRVDDESEEVKKFYMKRLRSLLNLEDDILAGMKIYCDSAAGAAYGFAKGIWESFGVEVKMVGPAPNGENINLDCGALHPENLIAQMVDGDADLGIAFDGDADRVLLVDGQGRLWDGDRILVAMAEILMTHGELKEKTIVLTEYSNFAAVKYLEDQGINVAKVENGDKEVLRRCCELGAILGGEVAGHIVYTPWLSSSDGIMVATWFLAFLAKTGRRLEDIWPNYDNVFSKQWSVEVRNKPDLSEIRGWETELAQWRNNLEGKGRVFVRYSGTEDKLRILVEACDELEAKRAGEALSELIRKEIGK